MGEPDFTQNDDFSPGTLVSSTNKTDRHDLTEILLKVALNTIKQAKQTIILKSNLFQLEKNTYNHRNHDNINNDSTKVELINIGN
jgi:hypothetical protein